MENPSKYPSNSIYKNRVNFSFNFASKEDVFTKI